MARTREAASLVRQEGRGWDWSTEVDETGYLSQEASSPMIRARQIEAVADILRLSRELRG